MNVGAFRALEREVVTTRGALYFTYWIYDNRQIAAPVNQGLLYPGPQPRLRCTQTYFDFPRGIGPLLQLTCRP